MRRIIKTVCATALCVVLFTGCSQPAAQSVSTETSTAEVEPLKIEFKEAEITKRTDTKSNIPEYTIISDSNEKYDVVWTSSDESVAKVEEGMLCTGKEGSAQITATIDDGVSASITVNVERKTRKASSYTHSSKSVSQEYRLNAEKVPSPAARKLQSGAKLSLHFRKSDEPPWSAKAVDRILHNEVYTGKLVQGKTRRLDYRSKKKMNVPMRDWTIVDNTHEAIVPAEQFELVQRILETETRRPNDAETVALFAGFLYCGDCGSRLVRRSASYKGKRYIAGSADFLHQRVYQPPG